MVVRFQNLVLGLAVAACSIGIANAATANEFSGSLPIGVESVPEAVERAFWQNSRDFFENRSIQRQIDVVIGLGPIGRAAFPDLEITRDAQLVNVFYRDFLNQQVSSTPIIRTPDLPNPYDTSLLLMPNSQVGSRVQGSELVFERIPLR